MRLDRLVRDLLSFSKPLQPRLADVEMTALVREAVRSLRADAEAAHVALDVEDSSERFVRGDPDSIHIALVNVLQNAIQASPDGGKIRIAVGNGASEVNVVVDDEGAGVPNDAIDRMFEPFFTTRATGSGLGLAILDRIMKAHGGHVRVVNLPHRGARFELAFPAK
jgi:signal transduction histidine kinase